MKVSIIISVLNGAKTLQTCLDSISSQDYSNIELVIIDGGSIDGTLGILKDNAHFIEKWISEKDTGIYDAWNKGLNLVTGDYICFIGSDDCFASHNTVSELLSIVKRGCEVDIITSNIKLIDNSKVKSMIRGKPWNWSHMRRRCSVSHPGLMHHKRLFQKYGLFDTGLKIAGDYDFLLRLGPDVRSIHFDAVTVLMGSEGVSNIMVTEVLKETRLVQARHSEIGYLRASVYYYVSRLKFAIKSALFKIGFEYER